MGGVCCIVGALGVNDSFSATAALHWPSVPGVIESNEIRLDTVSWTGRVPSPVTGDRFYLTYSYSVDDHRYVGSRIDIFSMTGKNYPRQYQARYPKGKAVEVRVDPTDPTHAVLETSWPIGSLLQAIGGVVLGVLLLRWSFGILRAARDAA